MSKARVAFSTRAISSGPAAPMSRATEAYTASMRGWASSCAS
jgi:hypothetical protein